MKELNFIHTIFVEDKKLSSKFAKYVNSIKLERDFEQLNNFNESSTEFNKLVNVELENIFNSVCGRLNKTRYNLLHTWIQKYNKKDWHQTHIHNPTEGDYSFIYYIECSDKSSPTTFYTPGHPYIMEDPIHVVAKKGRCVIFKGGIPHEVRPNNDNVRKVVSGNIKFI
tara:strand:- start:10 stop:513 length:504 start_codon:yes stop_codon:yes gene_type:complete